MGQKTTCLRCGVTAERESPREYTPDGWTYIQVAETACAKHFDYHGSLCPTCRDSLEEWRGKHA